MPRNRKRRNPPIHMGLTYSHGAHPFTWGSDWPFKRFSFTLNTNCHTLLGAWVTGLYVGWLGWAHMLREAFCSFRRACGRQVFAPFFPRQGESGYYNTHTHTQIQTLSHSYFKHTLLTQLSSFNAPLFHWNKCSTLFIFRESPGLICLLLKLDITLVHKSPIIVS